MTKEEKQILLKDLCARLPYGVMVEAYWEFKNKKEKTFPKTILTHRMLGYYIGEEKWNYNTHFLPYLRSLSSMTEEEENEYNSLNAFEKRTFPHTEEAFDYLVSHHFDFRGLIPLGLALPAIEGMYNIK